MSQTIHTIDLQLWIMGEVDSLCGFYSTAAHDIETDDLAVASLRFKNGALGSIVGSTATKPGSPRRLEIHGEKGTVILRDDDIAVWDVDGVDPAKYLSQPKKNLGDSFSKPGYADSTTTGCSCAISWTPLGKGASLWLMAARAERRSRF
jgi:predicted dehydrogenase